MVLLIRESFHNQDKGYCFGDTEWYAPYTEDVGKLYVSLRDEYGRCIGKYTKEDNSNNFSYYFEKQMKYEDCKEYYIREVCVAFNFVKETDRIRTLNYVAEVTNVSTDGVWAKTEKSTPRYYRFSDYNKMWKFE